MDGRYGRLADLMELMGLLQSRVSGVSIDQIADRFDVSRRTAERMLAALRDRFPELDPEVRDGHKYWKLPRSSRVPAVVLPEDLAELTTRIAGLEAKRRDAEQESDLLHAMAEDVIGTSNVGVFVLDADFRVVWINRAIELYFGIRRVDVVGRDKRRLIREQIRGIFEEPDEFERRVLATYDDNSYIEHFRCHIVADETRAERWLEHWSRPIEAGPYAGGRSEHYVDITALVEASARQAAPTQAILASALRSLRNPLAQLQVKMDEALASRDDPTGALSQISSLAERIQRSADQTLRLDPDRAGGTRSRR
ncbi:MAG: PAS domain-containing protein [Myxococcota bacterium]